MKQVEQAGIGHVHMWTDSMNDARRMGPWSDTLSLSFLSSLSSWWLSYLVVLLRVLWCKLSFGLPCPTFASGHACSYSDSGDGYSTTTMGYGSLQL